MKKTQSEIYFRANISQVEKKDFLDLFLWFSRSLLELSREEAGRETI